MTSYYRIFHFNRLRPEHQEYFYAIPSIMKSRDKSARHGLQVADMDLDGVNLFDKILEANANETIPLEEVGTIFIRESDSEYVNLLLFISWNQLED